MGRVAGGWLGRLLAAVLTAFVLVELNYPLLSPLTELALFAGLGLVLCFLQEAEGANPRSRWVSGGLAVLSALVALFLTVQTEPLFESLWLGGQSLGDRAGAETALDLAVGVVGLLLVLEAARRSVGWALPILAGVFMTYAALGPHLPRVLLPHRGYGFERIVSQAYLHSQGVYGIALKVMFSYVFLFVVLGVALEVTGATGYIIDATRRLFRRSAGGPAKVAVVSSGLMGSLSGSAVANTATTGTFTIPLMRSAGFSPRIAAGVEAAASSGGALVPPVMGAGAYMMLEIIEPQVSYLEIIRAAILPACLYYLSLLLIVHLYARRLGGAAVEGEHQETGELAQKAKAHTYSGVVFVGTLSALVLFLLRGFSIFRSVSLALLVLFVASLAHPATRRGVGAWLDALARAARAGVPLVGAAASVGIVIGCVTLTGVGTRLPALILPLAQDSLLLALGLIMVSSIILGMGLPSAVCYLLMATLIGPVLGQLGVVPLAAHFFIFYFGMMSMVTPPVALAAYAASSIAGSRMLETGLAAFRFALVGFALPYLFVFRPALLLLGPDGGVAGLDSVLPALVFAVFGVSALAAAIAGFLFAPTTPARRGLLLVAAVLCLLPAGTGWAPINLVGVALLVVLAIAQRARS